MISIIVPVYNVKPYLRKCLNSILNQTYRDLEILIVDDGSTDGSGRICDEYSKDKRTRIFHTENRGLSCARNLGLKEARGDWIGFVDSDDWIEPEMYEALLQNAKETGADVVECGYIKEFATNDKKYTRIQELVYNPEEAIDELIRGNIRAYVWNKIFNKSLFKNISFPEHQSFEDVATTYKLIGYKKVAGCQGVYYHYVQRESSISQCHDIQNLIDFWLAHKHRYYDLQGEVSEETRRLLLSFCASAIARTWAWYLSCENNQAFINELTTFVHDNYPAFGYNEWPVGLKIITFLARYNNPLSFGIAYFLNWIYRFLKPKYYR